MRKGIAVIDNGALASEAGVSADARGASAQPAFADVCDVVHGTPEARGRNGNDRAGWIEKSLVS